MLARIAAIPRIMTDASHKSKTAGKLPAVPSEY